MDTLMSMKVLRQVVESGSLWPPPSINVWHPQPTSKHVVHLEQNGALVESNQPTPRPDQAGTVYYEQCREMLDNLEMGGGSGGTSTVATWITQDHRPGLVRQPIIHQSFGRIPLSLSSVLLDL